MRALAAVLVLLGLVPARPAGAAEPWIGWDLSCDTQVLRLDDPAQAWRLLDGFGALGVDAGGGRPIEDTAGALVLLGAPAAETTLHVEAATDGRRADLALKVNGHDLGARTFRRRFDTLSWAVPAGVAQRGVNVVRLTRVETGGRHAAGLTVRRIGVEPLRCRGRDPAAVPVAADEPFTLSPEALVLAPLPAAAGGGHSGEALRLQISADNPITRAVLRVACWTETGVHPITRLEARYGWRAHDFVPLDGDCAAPRGVSLMGLGPGSAHQVRLKIEADDRRWRRAIRARMVALFFAVVGAALALAAALRGRVRWAEADTSPVRPPWLDVGWIVVVALALRVVFWNLYPRAGEAGDSYEYLLRAGFLIQGSFDFWRDLDWHSWGFFVRPPGYFALLALLDGPTEAGRQAVIMLQLVVTALSAGLTYLLAFPLFGRLAAWCAGLLFASYLGSVATFSRILAEPIYIFLALAGLAGVAWLSARPSWKLAAAAGALFGLAALVRPGPVYYPPIAGLLLLFSLGWRRGLRSTVALVAGLTAVVLPWAVRNSLVAGRPLGIETVSVANLLLAHPDENVVSVAGMDLADPEDYARYRSQIHGLALGDQTIRKGPHLRRILARAARDPGAHLQLVAANLGELLGPIPDAWLRWILAENSAVRVARLTTLLNAQYGFVLVFATVGFVLFLHRPRYWPVAAWFFFNTALLAFFFYSVARYREPTTPVLMAFAGGAISWLAGKLSVVKKSGLS